MTPTTNPDNKIDISYVISSAVCVIICAVMLIALWLQENISWIYLGQQTLMGLFAMCLFATPGAIELMKIFPRQRKDIP